MKEPNCSIMMLADNRAQIDIYDLLGPSDEGMIDAKLIASHLKMAGNAKEIDVHINSAGGIASEGIAIHNLLKEHPAKVNVVIDGVAASAASIVAMAGDTVHIPNNGMLMVHDPYARVTGNAERFQQAMNALQATRVSAIATYAAKTGQSEDVISQWMKAETWFVGKQAVEAGLADTTSEPIDLERAAKSVVAQNAAFINAPEEFSSLIALAMRQPQESPVMADTKNEVQETAVVGVSMQETLPSIKLEDVNIAVQNALAQERTRTSTIMTICQRANHPELANEFIAANLSVADVNAKLVEVLCKDRPPVGDAGGNEAPAPKDPAQAFKAEYAADRATFMKAGISEDDYVTSRQISAGVETLLVR